MKDSLRVAVVVSHPIQHFCPQYESFAGHEGVTLKVFFASALGFKKYVDSQFGKEVKWDINLQHFDHEFLNGEVVLPVDGSLDAPALEAQLQRFEPEIIIIYGYFQKLQRRARRWALRKNVKIAYISDSELRHERNQLKQLIKGIFVRRFFAPISYFLSVGNANESFYRHYAVPERKIIRMHFPIDIKLYDQAFSERQRLKSELRTRYGINESGLVLSVVGKLVPWKNQDHIIDAMVLLEEEGISLDLFIIGSGEMLDAWQKKAAQLKTSRVHFTGFQDPNSLPAFYAATDIYVHPASIEPHSIAVSEAIYMGCPVIISNTCGSYGEDDDVQEGKNGFVYPFGNLRELAAKIKILVTENDKRKAFSAYSQTISRRYQHAAHYGVLEKLKINCSS